MELQDIKSKKELGQQVEKSCQKYVTTVQSWLLLGLDTFGGAN